MQRRDLEGLTREELIAQAERLGVPRPRTLTQAELIDEILSRAVRNERERARARGFLGRARDLLARVVERGLHLPDAARALRGTAGDPWPPPPPPLPTVTLAEIYAAQGHVDRAIAVLDEVLAREPEHEAARELRARLLEQARRRGRRGVEAAAGSGGDEAGAEPLPAAGARPEGESRATAGSTEENVSEERSPTSSKEQVAAAEAEEAAPPAEVAAPAAVQAVEAAEEEEAAPAAQAAAASLAEAEPPEADVAEPEAAPLAEAEPLDEEEPLPDRYDTDEIVGMAVDPETLYLYWEVQPTTLARAHARRPEGQLSIRLIAVLPTWEGPLVENRDIAVDALFGDRFVRGIPAGANVRLSIGWLVADGFEPFAVGLEIAAPRAIRSGEPPPPPPWMAGVGASPARGAHAGALFAAGAEPVMGGSPAADRFAAQGRVSAGAADWAAEATGGAAASPAANDMAGGPERFPWGVVPSPEAIARAVAATRGGASELFREGEGPGDLGAPIVEAWSPGGASDLSRPGGASDLARLGGASDLSRLGGASDLARPGGSPKIESWFVSARTISRN